MMARGFGGRGRGFGGNRPRGGSARPITRFISRPTFDPVLAEPAFPRVKPLPEETEFNQVSLIKIENLFYLLSNEKAFLEL
jgi:hypothetical protein